jgi:hypothetical protein
MEHMNMHGIEYAGGKTLDSIAESRAAILARAPVWWRDSVLRCSPTAKRSPRHPSATLPAKPSAVRRWDGWGFVAGVIAPGVSVPVMAQADGQTLREQFTPACWQRTLERVRSNDRPVQLRLGHDGPVLAASPDDLTFRLHTMFGMGLMFTARLRAGSVPADIAKALQAGGLGVSIGYVMPKQWITERAGVGRVRCIDDCVVDHIALIGPSESLKPAYRGARCFGQAGKAVACPADVRSRAEVYAFNELKRQAGITV